MPRRTTLTYTSEHATAPEGEKQLHVYYCKYSGKHVLTTDCNLAKAPRRRTDGAIVIDTDKHSVKLYTSDGGSLLIKRGDGKVERQYRYNVGKLPVAYKSEPEGRFLYVLPDALTAYNAEAGAGGVSKVPVPPCIVAVRRRKPATEEEGGAGQLGLPGQGGGQQEEGPLVLLAVDCDDRASRPALLKITADSVRAQVSKPISKPEALEELLEFIRTALGIRLSQVSVVKGATIKKKELLIKGLTAEEVFEKLKAVATPGSGYGRRSRWMT